MLQNKILLKTVRYRGVGLYKEDFQFIEGGATCTVVLVLLHPMQEHFSLTGVHCADVAAGKPKRSNALKSLCLMLGPDFITEVMEVRRTISWFKQNFIQ